MTANSGAELASGESQFDAIGPAYEVAFAGLQTQSESLEWLKAQLESKKPAKVLDIGCGTGRPVCLELANVGHDVLGIDYSINMISAAKKNVTNARFEKADMKTYNPGDSKFDAATIFFSLIAGVTRSDIKEILRRIHSWLTPGGCFVFATVPMDLDDVVIKWMGRDFHVSGLTQSEIIDHLTELGFEIELNEMSKFTPKAVEAGICKAEDVWEENHLFIYAKKR